MNNSIDSLHTSVNEYVKLTKFLSIQSLFGQGIANYEGKLKYCAEQIFRRIEEVRQEKKKYSELSAFLEKIVSSPSQINEKYKKELILIFIRAISPDSFIQKASKSDDLLKFFITIHNERSDEILSKNNLDGNINACESSSDLKSQPPRRLLPLPSRSPSEESKRIYFIKKLIDEDNKDTQLFSLRTKPLHFTGIVQSKFPSLLQLCSKMITKIIKKDCIVCQDATHSIISAIKSMVSHNGISKPFKSEGADSSNKKLEVGINKFVELAEEIKNFSGDRLLELGKGDYLRAVLESLERIFSRVLTPRVKRISSPHVIVVGESGVGKSTFIGYLLKAKIIFKSEDGKAMYESEQTDQFPEIGHQNSKTKGIAVFGSYIDTGGLFDTEGPSAEICNSMAVYLASQLYPLNRLVYMFDSAVFNNRARGFFDLIDRLRRILRDATSFEALSSILFVVNDPAYTYQKSKKKIIVDIKHEIKTLKKRLIKSGFSYSQLKEFNKDDAAQEDQKRFIEDNPEVPEIYEKITILKMILTIDNIEVLDLKSDISRQRVEKKLIAISSPPLPLNMENYVMGGFQKFKVILRDTANYFNSLFVRREQLTFQIKQNCLDLSKLERLIHCNVMIKDSNSKSCVQDNILEIRDIMNEHKKESNEWMDRLKETREYLAILKHQREEVVKDETLIFWKNASYRDIYPPIFLYWLTPTREFKQEVCEFVQDIKYCHPNNDESLGKFIEKKKDGAIQIIYKPCGSFPKKIYQKDPSQYAQIEFFIKKKDHPLTLNRLLRIDWLINQFNFSEKYCERRIKHLQDINLKYQACEDQRLKSKENIESCVRKITDIKTNNCGLQNELKMISSKLSLHREWLCLVGKIIKAMKLNEKENQDENKIFNEFLNYVLKDRGIQDIRYEELMHGVHSNFETLKTKVFRGLFDAFKTYL
ncbi:hypothetical protein pah_c029o002 [Parachlamydia acanthamoebae str. Hall's coccus]|nr:hypothetical protein pah_c029o002 [Parachlamydia acanthamoebae str. Hall's coccus]